MTDENTAGTEDRVTREEAATEGQPEREGELRETSSEPGVAHEGFAEDAARRAREADEQVGDERVTEVTPENYPGAAEDAEREAALPLAAPAPSTDTWGDLPTPEREYHGDSDR